MESWHAVGDWKIDGGVTTEKHYVVGVSRNTKNWTFTVNPMIADAQSDETQASSNERKLPIREAFLPCRISVVMRDMTLWGECAKRHYGDWTFTGQNKKSMIPGANQKTEVGVTQATCNGSSQT